MLVKKISAKTVCGDYSVNEGEHKKLMRVAGVATRIVTGSTQYGDYVGFKGQFKAVNVETGEVFESGKCFLPDIISTGIEAELSQSDAVEFAFEVGIKYNEKVAKRYEYTAETLLEVKQNDPLEHLNTLLIEA